MKRQVSKYLSYALLGLAAITLAGCSSTMPSQTTQQVTLTPGTENISYSDNQKALLQVTGLELKGQVGIITAKERSSTTFTFEYFPTNDYNIRLDVPYTAKTANVRKIGRTYYYTEGKQTYSANSESKFAKALFGFEVPLTVLHKIVLGIALENPKVSAKGNSNLTINGNVVTSQVYQDNYYITYGDFKYLNNKIIVPQSISIRRGTDNIRIRMLEPYKYYTFK